MKPEKLDIYFWAYLVIAALTMYYVYIVVNPTFQILETQNDILENQNKALVFLAQQNNFTIEQNQKIIANQNNNTQALKQVIKENRINQEQAIYYLLKTMNQSNVIGNNTADDIQRNINMLKDLEGNQTLEHKDQANGIMRGFLYLLEDLDEDGDDIRQMLSSLANTENITLPSGVMRDDFKLQSEDETFLFPNGTLLNITELFRPAALLTNSGQYYNDTSGRTSSFLGGPLITNESVLKFGDMINITNRTANKTP